MPQFQVPQFIEKESKIIGPLTLKQFIYIAIAGGLSIIAFYSLPIFSSFLVLIISGGLAISFAFLEINGQPLDKTLLYALSFWQKPKKYIWKKEIETTTLDTSSIEKIEQMRKNISLQNKIKSAFKNITMGKIPFLKREEDNENKYQIVRHMTGEIEKAKKVDYTE
jgi:hypothetical protein